MSTGRPIPPGVPLRPELTLHPIRSHDEDILHDYLRDSSNQTVGIVREYDDYTFAEGLQELYFLEKAGISVAKRLPFIGPYDQEYLLVEHVEGKEWDIDHAHNHPEIALSLARKLGRYAAEAIMSGRGVLSDISDPFQYVLRDGEPVLVDLDMHQIKKTKNPIRQKQTAQYYITELSDVRYKEGLIPPSHRHLTRHLLAPLWKIIDS
jgi:hypothetical protein